MYDTYVGVCARTRVGAAACQSVPAALGATDAGARDAGGGERCCRGRNFEVMLTCAVACDW